MKEFTPSSIIEVSKGINQYVLPGYEKEIAALLTQRKKDELDKYFTNLEGRVTAWRESERGITAAVITARQSRSPIRDITELFWKEFRKKPGEEVADRVVNDFGDDSVKEDGSAYLFIRDVSVLTSLNIFFRHPLITGIEASTRYINWGELPIEDFVVHPEVVENIPEAKELYDQGVEISYETYRELWPEVWNYIVSTNPKPEDMKESVYKIAVKGAVCDALRGLLTLACKTNLAIHSNFRSLTELVMDMRASEFSETRDVGDESAIELKKVNPIFMKVVDNEHGQAWTEFQKKQAKILTEFGRDHGQLEEKDNYELKVDVEVLNKDWLKDLYRAALSYKNDGISDYDELTLAQEFLSNSRLEDLLNEIDDARTNRRHKVDFLNAVVLRICIENLSLGSFKDFNRHRPLLVKSEPDWSGRRGFVVPDVIEKIGGRVKEKYVAAQEQMATLRQRLGEILPEEAKLLNTHATKTSFEIEAGLTEVFWMKELRSLPSNNPENRKVAIGIHKGVVKEIPMAAILEKYMDQNEYTLGRIGEAVKADLKGKRND